MVDLKHLEGLTRDLIAEYELTAPPIPVEMILQNPRADMWDDLDITQISGSFIQVGDNYSPRMSMARVLARHITLSTWGERRGVNETLDDPSLQAFARMLVMPATMILELNASARTPELISAHFEVPVEDARLRLNDLKTYTP